MKIFGSYRKPRPGNEFDSSLLTGAPIANRRLRGEKKKELKKIFMFLSFPLLIFTIPATYLIIDYLKLKEVNRNPFITIGKVVDSKQKRFDNIVIFEYKVLGKTLQTSEYEFRGDKMLPLGLPIIIKTSIKHPETYILLRDSVIDIGNNHFVKYFHEFDGGWSYEIVNDE